MYGWAWFFRLAAELNEWRREKGLDLLGPLLPLERTLRDLTKGYLGRLSFPIRSGVHSDTAFALTEILKSSRIRGDEEMVRIIGERAIAFYGEDRDYPFA
ncbi:MAG: DUF2891 family protein, partial [Verrucomicrobiota bacterium]